jgi:phosphoglycerate kinase
VGFLQSDGGHGLLDRALILQKVPTLDTLDVEGKTVLVRVDFNVPLQDETITDDTRIRAAIPTLEALRSKGARVLICSHLGRPKGRIEPSLSLLPAAALLAELLDTEVVFSHESVGAGVRDLIATMPTAGVLVLENLRFDKREKSGDHRFAKSLATLADLFVNDAFGAMHRSHASITGIPKELPSVAGLLVQKEIAVLGKFLRTDRQGVASPVAAILGGAKVSDKMGIIGALSSRLDHLFIGGAMAYTFLRAQGKGVGRSRIESNRITQARELLETCSAAGVTVHLPVDHVVAPNFSMDAPPTLVEDIPEDQMGLDIGPATVEAWSKVLQSCKTILWNGPMGVFEWPAFADGTRAVAEVLSNSKAYTLVGGGDSAAAVALFGVSDKMDHISTGGGATLELLEQGDLIGLQALRGAKS